MLRRTAYDWPVITADELRAARIRAGYTSQAALAKALGVSERTVTTWEQEGGQVSPRSEAKVRGLLWPAPGSLSSYSNYELLSELGRRLDVVSRPDNEGRESYDVSTGPDNIRHGSAAAIRRDPVQGKAGPPPQRRQRNDADRENTH